MRGRWLTILVALAAMLLLACQAPAQPESSGPTVLVGDIKGVINPVMAGYVSRIIDEGEQVNAEAVVFYMDTPGGLSDATRDINLRILASSVPVIVYVAPDGARAGSAGVFIAYAAHLVGMAPATNIGSATPVAMGENGAEAELSPEMRAKVTNDAVAQIRALAELRGRDPEFAEGAVREGANLQASEALRAGVINYIAVDLPGLLRQADGARVVVSTGPVTLDTADATVRRAAMGPIESFLLTITNPTIAYILLSLGSLGLILELYNPGSVFPGVIGGICLLLAFYALGTLPVNFAALALIAFGLLLFALEPFVSSHGILAAGGTIAFVIGSLLLIDVPADAPYGQIAIEAIVSVTVLMVAFFVVLVASILRMRHTKVVTGREGLLGAQGEVRQALEPGRDGLILVEGELWRAVSPEGPIPAGEKVVVENVDGLLLTVRRASSPVASAAHAVA